MKNNPPIIGFIVEGLSDKDLLEQNFENVRAAHCDGTVMNNRIKSRIYALENHADIIYIFTDPDSAGDAFANRIPDYALTRKPVKLCAVFEKNTA